MIDKIRNKKIQMIKYKMLKLKFSPVSYDNKILDADETALLNINGKIQEILACEELNLTVSNIFWKDYNNNVHTWESQSDYKSWLQGLVIAISSRGTILYGLAWQKIAELNSMNDINDVITYDIENNWL